MLTAASLSDFRNGGTPQPARARPGRVVGRPTRASAAAALVVALLSIAGCGGVKMVATTNIPTPLVEKLPVAVALYMPKEFTSYVHKEERWSTDWHIDLGHAQSEGLTRLFNAMFQRVVTVDSVNAGAQLGGDVKAILEPSVEEYAFVTPRDAGSPFYAVSIKYRVNVYAPDGRLADSWGFTGYGTAPAQGMSSSAPLTDATALAMRDAGAKLAVEFRDQAVVRGLLPETAPAMTDTAPDSSQPEIRPSASETNDIATVPSSTTGPTDASAAPPKAPSTGPVPPTPLSST